MFSNDFKFYVKNQNRMIQSNYDNPNIMFSKISVKYINFPRINPKINDLVKSHESKDLIIKSNKKKFQKIFLKKKLNNYPRFKSNNHSFNLSYSKIFSLSSAKIKQDTKQNIDINEKINKMKLKNIRSIALFPNKEVPIKNSINLKRKIISNIYDKNEKDEKKLMNLIINKTRNKIEKKEKDVASIIKHEIKHFSVNSSPRNINLRNNLKIVSKSKSQLCYIKKIIPLKLGND